MSSQFASLPPLPTLESLGVSAPVDADATSIGQEWLDSLAERISQNNIEGVLDLFYDGGWWRDMLALTWDLRTFKGKSNIRKLLADRLESSKLSNFTLHNASLQQPYPDIAWIRGRYSFETAIGTGNGMFFLVPTREGAWKGFILSTVLNGLKDFPEQTGPLRNHLPSHGKWVDARAREVAFEGKDPQVLIVGGGQSGLDIAARLKLLGVSNLIIEKNPRVGDQWRGRYEALCLHDPVWYDHMPYLPFPSSWPVFTPAQKLANWLQFYAEAMELNIWTSSTVTKAVQDEASKQWTVTVKRGDGTERALKVHHLVFAIGFGGGVPNIPNIPGRDEFQGQVMHSSEHKTARAHAGKKVIVVGACTSAHDICADYVEHGVDVTIYQRSSTFIMTTKEGMPLTLSPWWNGTLATEEADLLNASLPILVTKELHKRVTIAVNERDKELLDGLRKVGYKLNTGLDGAGFLIQAYSRGGGYYLDVGACQMIIDGKIKLKNGTDIKRFTKTGLEFEDGSEVNADIVIYATGYGDPRVRIKEICGEGVSSKVKPIWGLDDEGELRTAWRDSGVSNLWIMMGNLAMCRFHSTHLALQIKAIEEGIFGARYH